MKHIVNGKEVYPLSKEEYKDMHKGQIKAYEKKWNSMTKSEQLNMIMYSRSKYCQYIRGIKEPEGYTNQVWFTDQYERNAWKNEAMEEYTNDR